MPVVAVRPMAPAVSTPDQHIQRCSPDAFAICKFCTRVHGAAFDVGEKLSSSSACRNARGRAPPPNGTSRVGVAYREIRRRMANPWVANDRPCAVLNGCDRTWKLAPCLRQAASQRFTRCIFDGCLTPRGTESQVTGDFGTPTGNRTPVCAVRGRRPDR